MSKNSKLAKFVVVSASALMMLSLGNGALSASVNASNIKHSSENANFVSKRVGKKHSHKNKSSIMIKRNHNSLKSAIHHSKRTHVHSKNNKGRKSYRIRFAKTYKIGESLGKLVSSATGASGKRIYRGLNYKLPETSHRYQITLDKGFLKRASQMYAKQLNMTTFYNPSKGYQHHKQATKDGIKRARMSLDAWKNYQKHSSSYAFRLGAHADVVASYRPKSLKKYLRNKSFINGWKTSQIYQLGTTKHVNKYYHRFALDIKHNINY